MEERPLPPLIMKYCTQDVTVLPVLLAKCFGSKYWDDQWECRVKEESKARLQQARSASYDPSRMHMSAPPEGWKDIKRVDNTRVTFDAKTGMSYI